MSCFVVSKFDIDILVTAYADLNPAGAGLLDLTRVGRELLRENIESLAHRYRLRGLARRTERRAELAGYLRQARRYAFARRPANPAAIAKIARCYDTQACEHAAYEASPAKAIVDALMARYPETLPGYADMPWGIGGAVDLLRAGCLVLVHRDGAIAN